MKILHVFNDIRRSGGEMMIFQALPYWTEAGVEMDLLSIGNTKGPFAPDFEEKGCRVHHLPISKMSFVGVYCSFRRLIRENRYDIVHIHAENYSTRISWFSLLSGGKVARTIHSNFVFRGWRKGLRRLKYLLLEHAGCRFITISDSVSKTEKEYHCHSVQLDNWCKTDRFRPVNEEQKRTIRQSLGLPIHATVFCSVGNCAEVKNHPLIIKAIKDYRKINEDFIYLHIGEEDGEHKELQLANEIGVSDRIKFLGRIDPLLYLQCSDLFIMPSLYEGFSIAGLEAILCGLHIVFSDVLGLCDCKKFNLPQLVYCKNEEQSLCDAIKTVLTRSVDLERIECIREHYSAKQGSERYLKLWKEMLHE